MEFSPDKLLICFRTHVSSLKRLEIHQEIGATLIDHITELNVDVVSVKPDQLTASLCRYSACNEVEYVERNWIAKATSKLNGNSPNDSLSPLQWGHLKIQAPQSWSRIPSEVLNPNLSHNRELKPVVVAVLDSGINKHHPDLSQKVVLNKNFSNSSSMDDLYGHGTHIAGIIDAITNNRIGVAAVAFNAVKLMNVKVLDDNGQGTISRTAKGIIFAANHGAKVINMSLASPEANETLHRAVRYATKKGVVLISSAGNYGTSQKHYPAAFPEVISVAATDEKDQLAGFSNYGGSWVDVAAPGVSIWSTLPTHSNPMGSRDTGPLSGTSQASSFVSGLAGLILAINPKSKVNVRRIIESNTDPIPGQGTLYKFGRINAFKAVKNVP
ncbi:S8 family serine peptidase [Neobacillus bataviensis]|uniref:S8 family serine peptidase n=1 Tax=Neobacillus bataviensis TaxID=220685 RepID=UPI001CC063CD|nr:S8 family serine peptidase [Neobacillus bataviensis]